MTLLSRAVAMAFLTASFSPTLAAGHLPTRIGQCVRTRVKTVGFRLGDMVGGHIVPKPGTGSFVSMMNGGSQVSYSQVPAVDSSRPGDPLRMCLKSLPEDCPPGDKRGIEYRTTNLRTGQTWTLPDSEHACGGA